MDSRLAMMFINKDIGRCEKAIYLLRKSVKYSDTVVGFFYINFRVALNFYSIQWLKLVYSLLVFKKRLCSNVTCMHILFKNEEGS